MAVSSTFAVLALLLWVPSALGTSEACVGYHVFVISQTTNDIVIRYINTVTDEISTTSLDNVSLPSVEVCGRGYQRCKILITSIRDTNIVLAVFPLSSGIGLVSYYNTTGNGTLTYRDKHVLTLTSPSCTFLSFVHLHIQVRRIRGYCLQTDATKLYSLIIDIDHENLASSSIVPDASESENIFELQSLSNFIFFPDEDDCSRSENAHTLFLESGYIIKHHFADRDFHQDDFVDSSCSQGSRLYRVGDGCMLAAQCNGSAALFNVRDSNIMAFPVSDYGQVFFCANDRFIAFRNDSLFLYTTSNRILNTSTPFPFEGTIQRGDCLVESEQPIFAATLDDGRSILVDIVTSSCRQLGESNQSLPIPSEVGGEIGIVRNNSDTLVYNIPCLMCGREPVVIPDDFRLATFISMSNTGVQLCPSKPSPSSSIGVMIDPTATPRLPSNGSRFSGETMSPSTSDSFLRSSPSLSASTSTQSLVILDPSLSPSPVSNPLGQRVPAIIASTVISISLATILTVVIIVFIIILRRRTREGTAKTTSGRYMSNKQHCGLEEYKKPDGQSINQYHQLLNKLEGEPSSNQTQNGLGAEPSSNQTQELQSTSNSSERLLLLEPNTNNHPISNPSEDVTKAYQVQQNFDNNRPSCVSASIELNRDHELAVPERSHTNFSVQESASNTYTSPSVNFNRDENGSPSIVNSQEERNFDSNTSKMLVPHHSTPTSCSTSLSNVSYSPDNPSRDPSLATAVSECRPVEASSPSSNGALFHKPELASIHPHEELVTDGCKRREERENRGGFHECLDAIGANREPNNDMHRQLSSSSNEENGS